MEENQYLKKADQALHSYLMKTDHDPLIGEVLKNLILYEEAVQNQNVIQIPDRPIGIIGEPLKTKR